MTNTPPTTADTPPAGITAANSTVPASGPDPRQRRRRRRRLVAGGAAVALLAAAGIAVAVTNPFASPSSTSSGASDNGYPISYATVDQEPLQSQTEVQGTLTYASGNNTTSTSNVVLPAGTGHRNTGSSSDLLVVGAYPNGMRWDVRRGDPAERDEVLSNIAQVPLPVQDPVAGIRGPLVELWTAAA